MHPAFSLPLIAAGQALRISVYTPAGTVNKYLSTPDDRAKAAAIMQRFKVSKIWIEGRRGDQYVTPELLTAARDDFRARGFAVSGGLTTVPGKTFGVQSNPGRTWMNFQAEQTQKEIAHFYTGECRHLRRNHGGRFLRDRGHHTRIGERPRKSLLVRVPQEAVSGADRFGHAEAGPCGKTFYARHHQIPAVVRDVPHPRLRSSGNGGGSQPDLGRHARRATRTRTRTVSSCPRKATSTTGGWPRTPAKKQAAAWFDHLDCTAQNFVDQAYQSVLAGAPELTLFNLGNLMEGHPGQAPFVAALPELFDLADKMRGRAVDGVYYYKPPASDGMENAYLMDYLAMIGLPVVPQANYPSAARVLFLGRQARGGPGAVFENASNSCGAARRWW